MKGSVGSEDLLGGGPGHWVLGLCVLGLLVVLAPIGLAALSFGAIMALFGGSGGGPPNGGTLTNSTNPVTVGEGSMVGVAPIQPVVASTHGLVAGWVNRDALNQYARQNYRTNESWQTWRNVDCSAAAFDWFLGAYGQSLGSIDDAIGLIGPGTGISTKLGLLDARGPALAHALAGRGLRPRAPDQRPLGSIAELKVWLDQGPLLMDGASWFGEGHWFVAIGYDKNGVYIRDSSGWDNRYLSWSRLYGEVGFSGWVVGVTP
jgi:hypothetical protein